MSNSPHRRHYLVTYDKRSNVAALAFGYELLDEHVLLCALQGFNNRFRNFLGVRQDDAHSLSSFQQLDDYRSAAHALDRWQNVFFILHECRLRDADVVSAENLHAAELVAGVRNSTRRVGTEHVHLLELPNDSCAEVSN